MENQNEYYKDQIKQQFSHKIELYTKKSKWSLIYLFTSIILMLALFFSVPYFSDYNDGQIGVEGKLAKILIDIKKKKETAENNIEVSKLVTQILQTRDQISDDKINDFFDSLDKFIKLVKLQNFLVNPEKIQKLSNDLREIENLRIELLKINLINKHASNYAGRIIVIIISIFLLRFFIREYSRNKELEEFYNSKESLIEILDEAKLKDIELIQLNEIFTPKHFLSKNDNGTEYKLEEILPKQFNFLKK